MYLQKRMKFYHLFYLSIDGRKTSISTKKTQKKEAEIFSRDYIKNIFNPAPKQIYLTDYCKDYLINSKLILTEKTFLAYEHSIKVFLDFIIPAKILTSISASDMQAFFNYRLSNVSVYQARKNRICLHALFQKAMNEDYIGINPVRNIHIRIPEKIPKYCTEIEFEAIRGCLTNDIFKKVSVIAFETGMRQSELLNLRWSQINIESREIYLNNQSHITKTKRTRVIPMSNQVFEILSVIKKVGDLIFTLRGRQIQQNYLTHKFKEAIRLSGVNPNLNFHSLRHGFATRLLNKGVNIYHIKNLLGHSNIQTTGIYLHCSAKDLQESIKVLN